MDEKESVLFKMRGLNNQIGCAIHRKGEREGMSAGEEFVRPLNHVQGFVMRYLYEKEGKSCPQKEIEERLRVARSTVAVMLTNMEERGLIVRTVSPTDSRKKIVSLSEVGIRSHEHFIYFNSEFEAVLLNGIPDEEVEAFLATIDKMKKNLDNIEKE